MISNGPHQPLLPFLLWLSNTPVPKPAQAFATRTRGIQAFFFLIVAIAINKTTKEDIILVFYQGAKHAKQFCSGLSRKETVQKSQFRIQNPLFDYLYFLHRGDAPDIVEHTYRPPTWDRQSQPQIAFLLCYIWCYNVFILNNSQCLTSH